jgi:argininosuccinate synthase
MNRKVVVACFGDAVSAATIERLAASADVIAVALDFGGVVSLSDMRDTALAAGAIRCHALDVREAFAREELLPALHARTFADPIRACAALAPAFAARKLAEIAAIEEASVIAPAIVSVATRPLVKAAVNPVHLDIGFENGIPVSINGVSMSLTELMESLETITGEAALTVLDRQFA